MVTEIGCTPHRRGRCSGAAAMRRAPPRRTRPCARPDRPLIARRARAGGVHPFRRQRHRRRAHQASNAFLPGRARALIGRISGAVRRIFFGVSPIPIENRDFRAWPVTLPHRFSGQRDALVHIFTTRDENLFCFRSVSLDLNMRQTSPLPGHTAANALRALSRGGPRVAAKPYADRRRWPSRARHRDRTLAPWLPECRGARPFGPAARAR